MNQPWYAAQAGFGSALQTGAGRSFREGSLGSAMQRGQGRAFREGSLGAALSLSNDNLIFLTIGAIAGLIAVKKGVIKKGFLGT